MLLLRRALGTRSCTAAASAAPFSSAGLLLLIDAGGGLLLLRRTRLLWSLLLLALWFLLLLGALLPLRLPLLLLLSGTRAALPLSFARLLSLVLLLAHGSARPLFELADLLFHVPLRLAHLPETQLVMAAVRAALPSLGIGLLAGRAKDAFWQRHREIGAHCTLRAMDENRRRTLEALLELAGETSPSACWDDQRAVELLRRQATVEELRELGADERLLAHIYTEEP